MSLDNSWAVAYEAPTSLDAGRVLGARAMRPTLWMFGLVVGITPVGICGVLLAILSILSEHVVDNGLSGWLSVTIFVLIPPTLAWAMICMIMAHDWGGRPAEHWVRVWSRFQRLPRRMEGDQVARHHTQLKRLGHYLVDAIGTPRSVVEVTSTLNLRLGDEVTLGGHIKKLHAFYVGLRFPIQIVIRAHEAPGGLVRRRWFVAVSADTTQILDERIADILAGLKRAGLQGRQLNGDLHDSLQECWSSAHREEIGPSLIIRERTHVIVDGEFVRGFVLTKTPRTVDANWLSPILDGDFPVDVCMWLDPIENSIELENLSARINDWESAQLIRTNQGAYRDPDFDEMIKDAQRTRLMLRRPGQLRVFLATIGFAVRGSTLQRVSELEHLLVDQLREHTGPGPVLPLDLEQDRAPLLGVPTGLPPIIYPIRIVTPALARSYPFSNSSLNMDGGTSCGTSKLSMRENKLNVWALTNPHVVILATTGAGKGYWLKVFLWRMLLEFPGRRVWIIQTEKDEYSAMAHALPPRFVYEHMGAWPRGEVIRIETLEEVDRKIYFYKGTHSLNGQQLTIYDLTRMPADQRGKAMAILLHAIEEAAAWDAHARLGHVVVDELGIVLRSSEAASALETAYRRFRSIPHRDDPTVISRLGMIGVSQRPSDLLARDDGPGKVIADLSETHVYLRQKPTELRVTKPKLKLSDDEAEYLELAEDGDGLMVAGRSRVTFHMDATEIEDRIAST